MSTMKAVVLNGARQSSIGHVPVPDIADDEVLIKVTACGVCGSDSFIYHSGGKDYGGKYPLIPGHEVVGVIYKAGSRVEGVVVGDRVVADIFDRCGTCRNCQRGLSRCSRAEFRGFSRPGGFAEYFATKETSVSKIKNITDIEGTLVEPTANAIRVVEVIGQAIGSNILVIGAGASGLMIAQILRLNGAAQVVVAANKGVKTQVAKDLAVFDEVVEIDRGDPKSSWSDLVQRYPDGFDVVVEATGSMDVANDAINYVGFGGTLLLYGGYHDDMRSNWLLPIVISKEIQIKTALGQNKGFSRAVAYLESGRIKTKSLVSHTFTLEQYEEAIKALDSRQFIKVAIVL